MGLLNSLLDAEARAVKKAVRSLDAADKHLQLKETDKAVAEADKARVALEGLDPKAVVNLNDYRNALSRLSNIYLELGVTTVALQVLDRFIKALPKDVAGIKLKVSALRKMGNPEGALALLDELVAIFPNDRDAHIQRKDILIKLERRGEAMQALLKALDADPLHEETYDMILEMTDDRPLWLGRKASALIHKDKAESALYELDTALKLAPRDLTLMMIRVEALEKLGKQEEADDLLDEVLQRDPLNRTANLATARKARAAGDGTKAIEHYKNVLRSDPESVIGWSEVAGLLMELGRYEESLRSYERLKEIMPDDIPALKGRMNVLAAMKDLAGLDAAAQEMIGFSPDDTSAHLFIIDTFLTLEAEKEAESYLDKAQTAFPKDLGVLDRRRSLHAKRKRFQEVITISEAQMAIKTDHLPAFQDLGQAQLGLGNVVEAIKTFERGLKIWPDDAIMLESLRECFKRAARDKDVAEVSDRLLRVKPNDRSALFDKAVAVDRLGRKEEAISLYGQVLTIDHNDVDASTGISVALFSLERYEEALARAAQGALHDPDKLVFWRIQADSLFMLKRFEEAVKAYDRAIALSPQEQKLIYQKGLCLESLRRFEEAIVCYDQAISLDAKDKNVWISKGIALEWLERHEEALACYDHALSLDKEGRFVHARRGQVLAKLARHEEAVGSFDKALEMGPKDIEVLTAKKNSLKSLGRYDDIVKVCDRIVKIEPKNKQAWVDRGMAQFRLSNFLEAVRSYDRALEVEPGDMNVLQLKRSAVVAKGDPGEILKVCEDILHTDPRNKSALLDKAGALERLGRLEEALSTFNAAIMLDEADPLLHKGKGRVLTSLGKYGEAAEAYDTAFQLSHDIDALSHKGRALLMMRNYDLALNVFDQCISMDGTVPRYHSDRGRTLASLNRLEDAVGAFDKALALDRNDAQTWKYKGNALFRLGEMENAMVCLNRALDLGADEFAIFKMRGRVMEELGRLEDAMDSYAKALEKEPNEPSVLEGMALIEDKLGNPGKAMELLDRSLMSDPRNRHAWMERADIAEKLKRDEEVLKSYDNAIGLDPSDPAAWNGKGFALLRLGRYDQARRGFEKALELNPNMTSATEGLRMADAKQRERQVAEMAGKVLEFQYRNGRRMSKEEVFREANVPYQMLDDVFAFLEQREYVDPAQLSDGEFASLEVQSRTALLMYYRSARSGQGGLSLSDVYSSLPERDIAQAKRVLGYIEGVNDIDFTYVMPDQETEKLLRTALNMPEDKRNLFSLMEGLNIGVYKARNILAIIGSLKTGERPAPMPRSKGQRTPPAQRPTDDLFVEPPRKKKPEKGPDAVMLPDINEQYERDGVRLFGQEERFLYDAIYPPKEKKKPEKLDEMQGRKCLFHGGLAVSTCANCGSMLCKECQSGGKCPRCGFVLGGKVQKPEEAVPEPSEPEERDWSRL
ncbi:MAG: lipoprotein NlpI [Methanomassiliicoccales archaeon PtaB.Bin215]|nr:MAG: lipoprotein NlpI [Methanomassiliicoccales archaeon PtaB.Bin215]